jgi:glycosyltransferase involved in cell wall biosynthesis
VARAEGPRSTFERALDRLDEARRRALRLVSAGEFHRAVGRVGVLNLLPTPPSARLGGVQLQFARRIEAEARLRPCALLVPDRDGWRLEASPARVALRLGVDAHAPPASARDASFEDVVRRAVELTGADVVHVENVAGLPLDGLARLAEGGSALVVSLHDFAPFCPRPLLVERPAGRFCGYERAASRCGACLAADGSGDLHAIEARRAAGARLVCAARALVFPSEFLRARFAELMPAPAGVTQAVIAPSSGAARVTPSAARAPVSHAAFIGAARPEKGLLVFEQVVEQLRAASVRFSAYGGGEPEALSRLRARGVRVCGYYRAGSLPRRLTADRVDAALLLSIGPESYGLTLDECAAAGVPAIVFEVGAPAERVRAWNAGAVVPLEAGARGVAGALSRRLPRPAPDMALPAPWSAAQAHAHLYARLGRDGA